MLEKASRSCREKKTAIARGKCVKEAAAPFPDALGAAKERGSSLVRQAHGVIGIARKLLEAEIGDLLAKVVAGDVFHFVGFVKHDGGIFRKDAAEIIFFQGQVGEKQVVVDDDQVRVFGALVHGGQETLLKFGALLAGAGVAPRIHARPQLGVVRQKGKFRAVAGFRQAGPVLDLPESVHFLHAAQNRLVGHGMHFCEAKEIGAALHHRDLEFGAKCFCRKGTSF